MRWKILDKEKALQLGIEKAIPDDNGIIKINLGSIPREMNIEEFIEFVQKKGIILKEGGEKNEANQVRGLQNTDS